MGLAKKLWTAQKQSPGNFLGLYKQININREKRINKTINVFFAPSTNLIKIIVLELRNIR